MKLQFLLGSDHKRPPDDAPGERPMGHSCALWKRLRLSKATLIALSVPRWLIVPLLLETTERGYTEVAKGFDRLDCPGLGAAFSRRPPDGCALGEL